MWWDVITFGASGLAPNVGSYGFIYHNIRVIWIYFHIKVKTWKLRRLYCRCSNSSWAIWHATLNITSPETRSNMCKYVHKWALRHACAVPQGWAPSARVSNSPKSSGVPCSRWGYAQDARSAPTHMRARCRPALVRCHSGNGKMVWRCCLSIRISIH